MAKNPVFPLYYNDLDRSTRDWTDEEFGCYVRLLVHQWDKSGLPLGLDRLSRIATSVEKNWDLIGSKFEEKDGLLKNPKLEEIRAERMKESEKQKLNGSKGGRPKIKITQNKPNDNPILNPEEKPNKSLHNEYEDEDIIKLLALESISKEEAKTLAMVVVEMMTIWMDRKPDYKVYKELDYHACLRIAYLIAGVKGFRFVDVTGVKESEVLKSWEKIALFIANHTFYTTLTLDAIGNDKMFQKIETSMREAKNNHGGSGMPADVTLAEARKNFKSQLPKE